MYPPCPACGGDGLAWPCDGLQREHCGCCLILLRDGCDGRTEHCGSCQGTGLDFSSKGRGADSLPAPASPSIEDNVRELRNIVGLIEMRLKNTGTVSGFLAFEARRLVNSLLDGVFDKEAA